MTNSPTDIPILDDDAIAEIESRANAATPAPWMVQDSCSWRRIGTAEPYADGNVICPITQYSDNHPDLLAARPDLEFIARAREDIPALCATVRGLRAEIAKLTTQWCQCGHAKDRHSFFSDHDECYECDQASPDLCCEWRPAPRANEYDDLQSQLDQVTKERDELRQREREQLTTMIEIRGCDKCDLCEDHQ